MTYTKTKSGGSTGSRTGYNLHEFRDLGQTLLHLQAKKDGFDMAACEHWMGHFEPLNYDKFYKDSEYVTEQYRIAERYLNLVSGTGKSTDQEKTKELESHAAEMEKRLTQYQNVAAEALTRLGNLEAIVERIRKIDGEKEKISH